MMKQIIIASALFALTGCVQIDNYADEPSIPAPAALAGYWQSSGPQSEMVSPDAIATLVIAENGHTFDCRQWQRVIATSGKLIRRDEQVYNLTTALDVYPVNYSANTLHYDHMTLTRVKRLTPQCAQAWEKSTH